MEFGDIPLELIANIIENLPLDDILNLLYTSKEFHDIYLLRKKLKEIGYDTEEDITISEIRMIIRNRGKVYATGNNKYGQLGLGDNNFRNRFTLVKGIPKIRKIFGNFLLT